jgi:tRNA A58 N-methylase Trm61
MKMRLALPIVFLCLSGAAAWAQPAEDPDAVAKALFPKDGELPHWRLSDIAARLGLHPGSQVADVGCGEGQVALVWSRAVGPAGHVWAEDIDPHALKAARKLMRDHHARNVTVLQGDVADPRLPPGKLDGITLFFVYHELVKYPEMLARYHDALKPGGHLVILDPLARKTASRPRAAQTRNHVLRPDLATDELRQAGFEVLTRDDRFVDDPDSEGIDWLIVARPAVKP